MASTPNLALPYIEAAQAQKHVTHNEALRLIDLFVQLAIVDRDLNAPPVSPADGQRWIVKASPAPTGAWAGHGDDLAAWQDDAWQFSTPQTGWMAYVADESTFVIWDGTAWSDFYTVVALQNLARLGLGTSADATNPFSAKLNNALWVARTVAEGGDGNLRYKLSKEGAAKTLSLLLQDNFSGRAEIGLTGDDNLHLKVSPDGSSWLEALTIDAASGRIAFPAMGGPRQVLTANRTYYVRTDGSDLNSGLANTAGGAFLTIQKACDTVAALDLGIYDATVAVAAGSYAGFTIKSPVGAGAVSIIGDETTPANVVVTSAIRPVTLLTPGNFTVAGMKLVGTTSQDVYAEDGNLTLRNIEYAGTGANYRVYVAGRAKVSNAGAANKISTGGLGMWLSEAKIYLNNVTFTLGANVTFSAATATCRRAGSYMESVSFTFDLNGFAVTGKRYSVLGPAEIATGTGANHFPGSSAGSVSGGGQYS